MIKPIYDNYWQTKEDRKKLKEQKPDKKAFFNQIMAMFFHREESERRDFSHKRSTKERRMRRIRHKSMMRNHAEA